jgi:putative ABC transport system permease protein
MSGWIEDLSYRVYVAYSRRSFLGSGQMIFGASSRDILRMMLRQGLGTAVIGIAIGLLGSLLLTRAIQTLLFAVRPTDPVTFAAVTVLLVATALLACYIPARRATKVNPIVALRYE